MKIPEEGELLRGRKLFPALKRRLLQEVYGEPFLDRHQAVTCYDGGSCRSKVDFE
ncbi:MAG: hypothetical protein IJ794_05255 [Lachnospiraceae bacterium]|nr:hypothetical protein [Lachnospiraceae bacterium]